MAESKGRLFYALNDGNLLLECESLEHGIRMNFIFGDIACWGMTSFQTSNFPLKSREERLYDLREKWNGIIKLNLE